MPATQNIPSADTLAVIAKAQRPDLYEAITGRPVWADQVGPEYRAAETAWLRYIGAQVGALAASA